jgi:hypothetical protein
MRFKNLLLSGFLFLISFSIFSQDKLRVFQYNLLYYGAYPNFCPISVNDPNKKDEYLRTILNHYQPDVFCVNELGEGEANAQRILDEVLNYEVTKFSRAASTNNNSSIIVNMLYYNKEKLSLYKQQQVRWDLEFNSLTRIIDLYTLYYNDINLSQTKDTLFMTFIVAHLKAGSTASDREKRKKETEALMAFLEANHSPGNILFSGDFNTRSSTEDSYQNLINYSNPGLRLYDPIDQPGTWYNNSNFANIHTQATRVTGQNNNGCFAGGGSDDRFDFILVSESVMNNHDRVRYIPDSYQVPGQDGNRFKQSLVSPANYSAPEEVISALYEMSDHYPVQLDLEIDAVASFNNKNEFSWALQFANPVSGATEVRCHLPLSNRCSMYIYNYSGQLIHASDMKKNNGIFSKTIDFSELAPGTYFIAVLDNNGNFISKKAIKF